MSLNKKGMSTVLMVIISATALLLFAMSLVALGRFQLENFLSSTRELEARGTCLSWRRKLIRERKNLQGVGDKIGYCKKIDIYNQQCGVKTGKLALRNCKGYNLIED